MALYRIYPGMQHVDPDWDIVEYNVSRGILAYPNITIPDGSFGHTHEILLNARCTTEYESDGRSIGFASRVGNYDPTEARYCIELMYFPDYLRIFIRGHLKFSGVPDDVRDYTSGLWADFPCAPNNNDIYIIASGEDVSIYCDNQLMFSGIVIDDESYVITSRLVLVGYPNPDPDDPEIIHYDLPSTNQFLQIGQWYGGIGYDHFFGHINYFKYRRRSV